VQSWGVRSPCFGQFRPLHIIAERRKVKLNIKKVSFRDINRISPLIAKFRAELQGLRAAEADEDIESAREEFAKYIDNSYPIFAYKEGSEFLGYLVCRIDHEVVWVESLYVLKEHRRRGIASKLFKDAEELAVSYGNETLYNNVHPNNNGMIEFLSKKGYNVLNLIEIRKKRKDDVISEQIQIRDNIFDY